MRNYTVVWLPSARNDLIELWLAASDRAAVTRAADQIDALLARDPYKLSEVRSPEARILLVPPLAVALDIREKDRLVTVWGVWRPQ